MITKKYYKLIRVSYADSDYFRVTNISDQSGTLTINGSNNLGCNIEYSTDGVNWTTADPNAPFSLLVSSNANVYMRGTNSTLQNKTINMDVNHTVGGNVYSLLDKATYASRTTSVGSYEFDALFNGNTHLVSAVNMNFGNVTTLESYCYRAMFKGCTSLTTAPELPATTLKTSCYIEMFYGCTSLNTIKCLATDISATNCTIRWVYNVAANGTFTKSVNMSSWTIGYGGIPSGWTVVDA